MEESEEITLDDALVCIRLHFTEDEGLIARIEQGLSISTMQMRSLENALAKIREVWAEQDLLLKQNVRLLWNVIPRLEKSLAYYPEREKEIEDIIFQISAMFDQLFTTSVMSEENAIAVVSQHVIGPSFVVEMRLGMIDEDALDDLFIALDTLNYHWKKREYVSKIASGAMINMQGMIDKVSGLYREPEMKRLRAIEQQLFERINRCFED